MQCWYVSLTWRSRNLAASWLRKPTSSYACLFGHKQVLHINLSYVWSVLISLSLSLFVSEERIRQLHEWANQNHHSDLMEVLLTPAKPLRTQMHSCNLSCKMFRRGEKHVHEEIYQPRKSFWLCRQEARQNLTMTTDTRSSIVLDI